MQRLIRDTVVAVAGGIIVGLIVTFTTSLNRVQLAIVYAGSLVACGLFLGCLELPRLIGQRREAFKNEVIAAARSTIMNDIATQAASSKSLGRENISHSGQSYIKIDEREALTSLLQDGYKVRARLREFDYNQTLNGPLAVDINNWEGMVLAALVDKPNSQRDFRNAPGMPESLSTTDAYRRVEYQTSVLEEVIRSLKTRT